MSALGDLRVVELGGDVSAAYAAKLLADLGARVDKIESAGGDRLRSEGPWPRGRAPDPLAGGGLFRYLNRGKRSAVLEPSDWLGVAAAADVIIENLGPGQLESAGLSPARLEQAGFTGALVRISDFGQDGPWRELPASGLTLQSLGGWVSAHGLPGHRPVQVGGRLPEFVAGSFAGCAALTAAMAARDLGRSVSVDLAVLECLVGTLAYPMLFQLTLSSLGLPPPELRYSVLPGIVRCADGWAGINALTGQHWQDICAMVGADEFAGSQREVGWGGALLDRFLAEMQPFLDAHSVEGIVELSQAFRIPAAPVGNGATLALMAPFASRGFYEPEEGASSGGPAVFPGPPYRLSATPARKGGVAPLLGADTHAILAESTSPAGPPRSPGRSTASDTYLPLEGLRVIDLGTFWAGPYVGLYLGSIGADVIKVESTRRPDGFRFSAAFPQEGPDWYERSGLWQATNLNKRGITLDLTQPGGVDLIRRLVAGADVLIENFSPRVVEQFGLGYEALRALNPSIIMLRMPGFGVEGPWRDYVGWAMSFEQASGMAQVTGEGTRPINPGGFLDPVVGMHAALAVQAAVEHRRRTGTGQLIEVAQVEAGACLTAEQVITWSLTGEVCAGIGNRSRSLAPQGVYACADGPPRPRFPGAPEGIGAGPTPRWVSLAVRDDADWAALIEALGRPTWAQDPALARVEGRLTAHDAIDARITDWTATRSPDEVVSRLRSHGVPVAGLLHAAEMYDVPQLAARGYYQEVDHPLTGARRYPAWPMRFSFLPAHPHRRPAPMLGQHNDEVLGGELGLSGAELDRLRQAGVIGEQLGRG